MAAGIYIISGFLGAGKTTLIRKLLSEAFRGERVILVENDFGDVSVDAALMREDGVEVAELASGCICCTIADDFVKSLRELIARHSPDSVIVEPSGVGKLSDIAALCEDASIRALAEIRRCITVVDARRCTLYSDNFGEFFEDQIARADAIVLSRCDIDAGAAEDARALARRLNAGAAIFSAPWSELNSSEMLAGAGGAPARSEATDNSREHCGLHAHSRCGADHAHDSRSAHDNHGDHGDHSAHDAEDAFDTITIRPAGEFEERELREKIARLELHGTLLRAKGILRGRGGFLELQYVPGELKITRRSGDAPESVICAVGRDLDAEKMAALFVASPEAG